MTSLSSRLQEIQYKGDYVGSDAALYFPNAVLFFLQDIVRLNETLLHE